MTGFDSRQSETISALTPGSIPGGLRLCRASGWNQLEEDWRVFLESPSSGGFLAEKDGRVVGTAAYIRYGDFAWIAMMLVDPGERRTGIGSRLLARALEAVEDARCVGLDATPFGEPLYRRFGFEGDYSLARTKATAEAAHFPKTGRARPMSPADLSGVLQRDREVFGADRSALLKSLLARSPECAWIADGGYMFGRPGYLYHQLGPVVAENAEIARHLVAHAASELDGKKVVIDAPKLDVGWLAWLDAAGFVEERPFLRMFRKGDRHPGEPARHYAITGPEFA